LAVEKMQKRQAIAPKTPEEFDKHVEKYLSMVLHHEEVQQMAEIAKKVFRKRLGDSSDTLRNN
jgi:hypothetical protein